MCFVLLTCTLPPPLKFPPFLLKGDFFRSDEFFFHSFGSHEIVPSLLLQGKMETCTTFPFSLPLPPPFPSFPRTRSSRESMCCFSVLIQRSAILHSSKQKHLQQWSQGRETKKVNNKRRGREKRREIDPFYDYAFSVIKRSGNDLKENLGSGVRGSHGDTALSSLVGDVAGKAEVALLTLLFAERERWRELEGKGKKTK